MYAPPDPNLSLVLTVEGGGFMPCGMYAPPDPNLSLVLTVGGGMWGPYLTLTLE